MPIDWPYGDLKLPTPAESRTDISGSGNDCWAHYVGMQPVTEAGGRLHPALGGAAWLGYHLVCAEDYYLGTNANEGRWLTLFTPNDYQNGTDLTKQAFHASERRLLGHLDVTNGDPLPDMVTMHNTVFMTDGKGRWLAGQAPAGFVFLEDNSGASFTDYSSAAASLAADDVHLLVSGDSESKVNDALYIGAAATFSGFWMDVTTAITLGSGGTHIVQTLEYWNGSAWTGVSTDASSDTPFLYGSAGSFSPYTSAQQQRVTWDHPTQMSDWATTTVNSQSAYWVRLRVTTGATGTTSTNPKARSVYLVEDNAQKTALLPVSYEIGEDPGTTAPSIKGWGLHRLDVNGTEQISVSATSGGSIPAGNANVYYTWYDSTRDIESDPVALGNLTFTNPGNRTITVTLGDHPDPNVDKARVYISGTGTGTLASEPGYEGDTASIGVGLLRLVGEFSLTQASGTVAGLDGSGDQNDRTTAWETIDRRNVGDGPYLASTIPNGADLQPDVAAANGYYNSCCVHKGRIYCAGTDVAGYQHRVVWSVANQPNCFPKDNYIDVPMPEGDRIVAIRAAGQVVVVLGARSIWSISADPEGSSVAVGKIADVGALAKRACITVGQRCFFLGAAGIYAVGSGGAVELVTPQLTRLFRDIWKDNAVVRQGSVLYQHLVHAACAGYDPSREYVLFALPGLLQQLSGADATDRAMNDAMIQIDLVTGRSSIWVVEIGPSAMAAVPMGNSGFEMWYGTSLGRLQRFTTDALDTNTTAAISGTVAGTHSATTLQDTTLSLTASSSNTSFVGHMLYKTSSTGANPEGRMIVSNTTDTFTVEADWTNNPVDGDLYYIGHYWMSVETGDITDNDPGAQHRLQSVRLHLEGGMNSSNALTALSTDELRAETTTWNAGGTLTASTPVEQLSLAESTGFTQRLRLIARMGAARFRIFALAVKRAIGGRPRG